MNVLCLGSEVSAPSSRPSSCAPSSPPSSTGGERYVRRLEKIEANGRSSDDMADSRLHQLAELGQSPWIDYLSRNLLTGGRARAADRARTRSAASRRTRRSSRRRSPRGTPTTSSCGSSRATTDDPKRALHPARGPTTCATPATSSATPGRRARAAATATSRSRSTRRSPTTRRRRSTRPQRLHELDRPAEPLREDPRRRRRACPRSRR